VGVTLGIYAALCNGCFSWAKTPKDKGTAPSPNAWRLGRFQRPQRQAKEGRDYQWLYRLSKQEKNLREALLRLPKPKERLAEIKARQQNSTRCQRLIHEMRLHVAPTNE
jgi:hypothetical protein